MLAISPSQILSNFNWPASCNTTTYPAHHNTTSGLPSRCSCRLGKIEALEQRLNLLVDNVEGRLGRLLGPAGPLAATAQQLAALQLAGGGGGLLDEWEVVLGPDGQPLLGPDGRPVLRRKGAGAGGGGQGGAPLSPRSAGMSVLELQKMLIAINRMESKETEIR